MTDRVGCKLAQRLKVVVESEYSLTVPNLPSTWAAKTMTEDFWTPTSHGHPKWSYNMEQLTLKEIQRLAVWLLHIGRVRKDIKTQKAVTP